MSSDRQAAVAAAIESAAGRALLPSAHERARLIDIYNQPTAVWIDQIAAIPNARRALADAAQQTPPPLVLLVVYDLPNRDCAARSSGGELCCVAMPPNQPTCQLKWGGDCTYGLRRYADEFIGPIAALLGEYASVPIALIIEPDSLPNLITSHTGECRGGATTDGYKRGVAHAVRTLAPLASAVYLDAGHGGWVSYQNNLDGFLGLLVEMDIWGYLRGFSTNVANYQPLGTAVCDRTLFSTSTNPIELRRACGGGDACCDDPCHVLGSWGWGNSELHYGLILTSIAASYIPGFVPHVIIDTSRNGHAVTNCRAWCNVRNAALGEWPTNATLLPDAIDAYVWVKPPGESDGCSSPRCGRFDPSCASYDSLGGRPWPNPHSEPPAPEAGVMYSYQLVQLARAHLNDTDRPPNAPEALHATTRRPSDRPLPPAQAPTSLPTLATAPSPHPLSHVEAPATPLPPPPAATRPYPAATTRTTLSSNAGSIRSASDLRWPLPMPPLQLGVLLICALFPLGLAFKVWSTMRRRRQRSGGSSTRAAKLDRQDPSAEADEARGACADSNAGHVGAQSNQLRARGDTDDGYDGVELPSRSIRTRLQAKSRRKAASSPVALQEEAGDADNEQDDAVVAEDQVEEHGDEAEGGGPIHPRSGRGKKQQRRRKNRHGGRGDDRKVTHSEQQESGERLMATREAAWDVTPTNDLD